MTTAIVDEEDISNMEEDKEKDRERGQLMQHLIDVFLLMLYECQVWHANTLYATYLNEMGWFNT